MSTYAIYRLSDGAIVSHFTGPERALRINTPRGCATLPGQYDGLSQRVELATGLAVDWRPQRPDEDHEWSDNHRRWVKRDDVVHWENERSVAHRRLAEIDASRIRALSDQAIDPSARAPDGKTSKERLAELEARAEEYRAVLRSPKPAPSVTAETETSEPVSQSR